MPRKSPVPLVKVTWHVAEADLATLREAHPEPLLAPAMRALVHLYAERLRAGGSPIPL